MPDPMTITSGLDAPLDLFDSDTGPRDKALAALTDVPIA
jgi:hypothetical protein